MQWTFDPSHTSLQFAVRHMAIATVRGRFRTVEGTIETTDDGRLAGVEAMIHAGSIDTAEPNRDAHLRSPDFLDAANYPTLTFRSTQIEPTGDDRYRVAGELTIRGETRAATLDVETAGPMTDPYGNLRGAASATGRLNRRDWGLTWNQVLELGALLVGEEVRFTIDIEAVAQVARAA